MKRMRFNIASLLVVILVLGIGLAALRESSDVWESSLFTLTLAAQLSSILLSITVGVLLISILLAVHSFGSRRAFWLGFTPFGWIYLVLSQAPSIEHRLITTKALAYLDSKMPGRSMVYAISSSGRLTLNGRLITSITSNGGSTRTTSGRTENFVGIGHSFLALMAAFLGGLLSRHLHARNLERRSEPPEQAENLSGRRSAP
jgi:hypothetical protein